jgi:hypothetical protein
MDKDTRTDREKTKGSPGGLIVYDGSDEAKHHVAVMAKYNEMLASDAPIEDCIQVLVDGGIWDTPVPDDPVADAEEPLVDTTDLGLFDFF